MNENPIDQTIKDNQELENLIKSSHISKNLFQNFKVNTRCSLGKLRLLHKLHKNEFGDRAIINCTNNPTSKISNLINQILQPFVQNSETYLKDSQNLLQKYDKLELNKNC